MTDQEQILTCGVQDEATFAAAPFTWKLRELLWWPESYPSGPNLTQAKIEETIAKAFWFWSQHCPIVWKREPNNDRYKAHIVFKTAVLPVTTAAKAQYPYEADHVNQLSITFNSLLKWAVGITVNEKKLEPVLGHEIGHTLGLTHSTDPKALMYHELSFQDRPQAEDIARIQELYGPAVTPPPPLPVPPQPPVKDEMHVALSTPDGKHYSGKLARIN